MKILRGFKIFRNSFNPLKNKWVINPASYDVVSKYQSHSGEYSRYLALPPAKIEDNTLRLNTPDLGKSISFIIV